jgi:FkbM family methyltransferase
MSLSIKLGNFLYNHAFGIYKPLYFSFKKKQDAFEIELLKKYINSGDVVLDIGANIGFYANLLSTAAGTKGQVHCFEPDERNFSYLKKSAKGFHNLVINNAAVGPETGHISIFTSKELNVDHRTYKPAEYEQELNIKSVAIDDYLATLPTPISKVDFIKMDIQGFEMEAIKGMEKTLNANPDIKLISEFWPYGLRTAGSSVIEYFNILQSKKFNCYLLEKNTLTLLTLEKVKAMEPLEKEHYFNIFISRSHV